MIATLYFITCKRGRDVPAEIHQEHDLLLKLEEDSKSDMQYMQRASHLLEALLLRIDESAKILDNRQENIRKHKKIVRFEDEREILKAIGGSADRQGAALQ